MKRCMTRLMYQAPAFVIGLLIGGLYVHGESEAKMNAFMALVHTRYIEDICGYNQKLIGDIAAVGYNRLIHCETMGVKK